MVKLKQWSEYSELTDSFADFSYDLQ